MVGNRFSSSFHWYYTCNTWFWNVMNSHKRNSRTLYLVSKIQWGKLQSCFFLPKRYGFLEMRQGKGECKVWRERFTLRLLLQVHIQTIGILVAEKTELQSHLAQSQKIGGQRLSKKLFCYIGLDLFSLYPANKYPRCFLEQETSL